MEIEIREMSFDYKDYYCFLFVNSKDLYHVNIFKNKEQVQTINTITEDNFEDAKCKTKKFIDKHNQKNNIKIKADCIASALLESNFFIAGMGHFDLSFEEISKLIKIAIESNNQKERINKMQDLYEEYYEKAMI